MPFWRLGIDSTGTLQPFRLTKIQGFSVCMCVGLGFTQLAAVRPNRNELSDSENT